MQRNRSTRQSLSYGSLEPKRLLAGNVNANFNGDHIYIRGDQQDNQIRIYSSDGTIRIAGIDGTTINRRAAVTVGNSTAVSGDARVTSQFAGGLRVHMGPGNDSVNVDGIRFHDLSIVYGGTGDDFVNISKTDFFSTAIVQTFDGDDNVAITNTQITDTLFAMTLDGDDSLTIENTITRGSAIMATGTGDDYLKLASNQHLGSPQFALTQDGADTVEILNPNIGTGGLEIFTGDGDDEVSGELVHGVIDGNVIIAGQGDTDISRLTIAESVSARVSLRGFEFNNEVVYRNASEVDYGFASYLKPDDSFFVADFVEFNQRTRLSSIEWLGSYENSTAPLTGDNFVIEIYEGGFVDDPSIGTYQAPVGNPVATFNVGNNANREDTGRTWSNLGPTRRIFSYSADIDFTMASNRQYWISIYSMPTGQGADLDNDFYILVDDIESELDSNDGAANVKWSNFPNWYPNTSAKTHFTLRS
ncbi:hypothetical protein [Mariniblastus fucicola]|uniref:Uncharacterized protein n=1 Tax=Mariniblastus fucicola TaxID=980251 RepID=A0A5B9P9S8_9BACT|nr:hypothetical protein [Mariniblastus fucicola]QEG23507.1 hypothetical protein MFFC18_34060 [Mariniblastus fucicola]